MNKGGVQRTEEEKKVERKKAGTHDIRPVIVRELTMTFSLKYEPIYRLLSSCFSIDVSNNNCLHTSCFLTFK
jgi:hypothetical protein